MILFVFEGKQREPYLYRTLEKLFLDRNNPKVICSFENNIYQLYQLMQDLDGDGDIVAVLRESLASRGDSSLDGYRNSDFAEVYLFFDYDFQHRLALDELNRQVEEMLDIFRDETENGKLYINYPMIESIRHVKELPDKNYHEYTIDRNDCSNFKKIASDFSFYPNLSFIVLDESKEVTKERYVTVRDNWVMLTEMNVSKANYLVSGKNELPAAKQEINQHAIFKAQRIKYVTPSNCVSILNSFPLFLYEYCKLLK